MIRGFLSRLCLEIIMLCVMRDYTNMDELLAATLEVEWMLTKLRETPFELLNEKQEEGAMANTNVKN